MMENESLRAALNEQLSNISVSEEMEKRIMALPKARQKAKRRSMVTIVVCGVLLIALSGLAATNPGLKTLLLKVGDRIAQLLQPIELVSESDGIRMELVAAMCDDRNAVLYFTLQDLTGDRLEGLIDPYDCGITGTRIGNPRTGPYDKKTHTAMLSLLTYGGDRLDGQQVTFSLNSFLVGRTYFDDVDIGIPLDTVQACEQSTWLAKENSSGGGGEGYEWFDAKGGMKILLPNETHIPIPGVDFAYISNIGLIDGYLHVQTCYPKKKSSHDKQADGNMDDHGGVWLMGSDNQASSHEPSDISVYFAVDDQGELCDSGYRINDPHKGKVYYTEEVFSLKYDLSKYTLHGNFTTNKEFITGDWSVTFRLQAIKAYKQAACDIDVGTARIQKVMVSPMGWTILGEKETADSSVHADILVKMADGSEEHFGFRDTISDETSFEYYALSDEPLDINLIQKVYVNGQEVQMLEKQ